MHSLKLRVIASAFVAVGLGGCSMFGSKQDPNAPNRFNTYQQETARAAERKEEAPAKIDNDQVAKSNLALASQYYAYGRYSTALDVINRSLQADPSNAKAWSLAGFINFELNDLPKANEHFAKSMALGQTDPDVLHNYATFLCRTGKELESIGYFDRALAVPTYQRPASSETGAGACFMKLGRDEEANARFMEALKSEPMNPQALIGSAQLAIKKGDAARARNMLTRYQQIAPSTATTLWLSVLAGRMSGNKNDEQMAAQDLRNNFPDSPETRLLNALPAVSPR